MKKILLFTLLTFFVSLSIAQKKYAVLITGDYAAKGIPFELQFNKSGSKDRIPMEEFWNDTFLQWSYLTNNGFADEDVFVLFADGKDYPPIYDILHPDKPYSKFYKLGGDSVITDYAATFSNVEYVFNHLKDVVTADDFLYIWTFDHGGFTNNHAFLCLVDLDNQASYDMMYDTTFARLVLPIKAHKKVIFMQQCHSGGFADDLEDDNIIFFSACKANEYAYRADDSTRKGNFVVENEVIEDKVYYHGEFNFHNYSVANGCSPTYCITDYDGELYSQADDSLVYGGNNDNLISIEEIRLWETLHNSRTPLENPVFQDPGNLSSYTSFVYPTLLYEDISRPQKVRGIIGVTKDIHITRGNKLTILPNSKVYFENNSTITVDVGGELVIGEGSSIYDGHIVYTSDIKRAISLVDVNLKNTSVESGYNNVTNVYGCIFENCGVVKLGGFKTTVSECSFNGSSIEIIRKDLVNDLSPLEGQTADIVKNNFRTDISLRNGCLIKVDNFKYFGISENEINGLNGNCNGIEIYNSGTAGYRHIFISDNNIYNCQGTGIISYQTASIIHNNKIYDNYYGVKLLNNSVSTITGNESAAYEVETQVIRDNYSYEIYASKRSFPSYTRYNVIKDNDNLGNPLDPIFYYDNECNSFMQRLYLGYNNWGTGFDYISDIYPLNCISVEPQWSPTNGVINPNDPPARILYKTGMSNFEDALYSMAESNFKLVIETYPRSVYASDAMKMLLKVADEYEQDYSGLITYYQTTDSIQSYPDLKRLAGYLENSCDIALKNYARAISFYEEIISSPTTDFNDSIFAVIDVGYVYLLMENDTVTKTFYDGEFSEYSYSTFTEYSKQRDYLLSLVPGISPSHKRTDLIKEGDFLSQNTPNPTSGTTSFSYTLPSDVSKVSVIVYDQMGKTVKTIDNLSTIKGVYNVDLDVIDLSGGVYFYSLYLDNKNVSTKKMIIIR